MSVRNDPHTSIVPATGCVHIVVIRDCYILSASPLARYPYCIFRSWSCCRCGSSHLSRFWKDPFGTALPSATPPSAAARPRRARLTRHKVVPRKNGPQRQTRKAGRVERSRPRSPIWRGVIRTSKSQYDAATQYLHDRTHVPLMYVRLRCGTCRVGG